MPNRMLTITEAAKILFVHPNTLRRWDVPHFRVGHRNDRRYSEKDIRGLMRPAGEARKISSK